MKVVTTQKGFFAAIEVAGGINSLVPISTYTYCDGSPDYGPGRHIYTEWGTRTGEFVAEQEEHNGVHTYRVRA